VRKRVFSAAFIFEPGEYDAEFHRLNERIEQAAESMSGFLGAEVWTSTDGKRFNQLLGQSGNLERIFGARETSRSKAAILPLVRRFSHRHI
jgi:hypothetical protein